ncbi:MAG TPA: FAD-dependent oxidoreductase, partial [Blastocatellia bacterium]
MTSRRNFLQQGSGLLLLPFTLSPALAAAKELRCDVAIIGGGFGGVAAALAACRSGQRVILTEETDWIGGQVTAQAVPLDEHRWIESFGSTLSYRQYRTAIRQYYRDHYPLTAEARARWNLNPGNASVSRVCHEPRVSVAVLSALLAPYISSGRLTILLNHKPVAADIQTDRVRSVTVRDLTGGRERTITAPYFLDATETGELLPLTKTEYVTGFESRKMTGELHAPDEAQPLNMQAVTWCFAMDHLAGEDHTIDQPAEWKYWRDHVPQMKPAWPGKLLAWEQPNPQTLKTRGVAFDPDADAAKAGLLNFMIYRRIIARDNFLPGTFAGHITVVNWPMNDYFGGPVFEVSEAEVKRHLYQAKQLSLSLLYWMQTEAPRPD